VTGRHPKTLNGHRPFGLGRRNGSKCPEADPRSGAARSGDEGRSKLLAAELGADLAQFESRIDNRLTGIDGRISSIEGRLANLASAP